MQRKKNRFFFLINKKFKIKFSKNSELWAVIHLNQKFLYGV